MDAQRHTKKDPETRGYGARIEKGGDPRRAPVNPGSKEETETRGKRQKNGFLANTGPVTHRKKALTQDNRGILEPMEGKNARIRSTSGGEEMTGKSESKQGKRDPPNFGGEARKEGGKRVGVGRAEKGKYNRENIGGPGG